VIERTLQGVWRGPIPGGWKGRAPFRNAAGTGSTRPSMGGVLSTEESC